ncbi:MAG: hypothetical protein LUD82_04575 [Clostridiales bacterium]|nr:hypothetical protein [Clostridiales bacterium]
MAEKAIQNLHSQAEVSEQTLQPPRRRRGNPAKDISGQHFRMLTALYPTEKRDRNGTVIWHCRCDCGQEVDVPYEDLVYGQIISCGCRKKAAEQRLGGYITYVSGTAVDILKSKKMLTNNKSGVTGVFQVRGRYRAEIRFQGVRYRLGTYKTLEEAATVRRKAEQQLHVEFLEHYKKWKARADADPAWGEANPVVAQVVQKDKHDFELILQPELDG